MGTTHRLVITIPFGPAEGESEVSEEDAVGWARAALEELYTLHRMEGVHVSLTREGDRSGSNLLLPRVEGRTGSHLQNRKASLLELGLAVVTI